MRVLDLFAGIGGFSLGLEAAGMETVGFCEIEDYPRKILKKHWPDVPIFRDIRTLTGEQIREKCGRIDLISAGWPCPDISTAGRRAGLAGERSGLFWEVVRSLRVVRPKYAILENVAGLLTLGMGEVQGALAEIGYDAEWGCLSASEFGAPHKRERVFIVANPQRKRFQRPGGYFDACNPTPDAYREASGLVNAFQGNALPYVCKRHDGVPPKLAHEMNKALGNAVIPQIVEQIGRAIMECQ